MSEAEIWEGVCQGVLIADFRIYVPMLPTSIQIAVPKGMPPQAYPLPDLALGSTESAQNDPRVTNKVFPALSHGGQSYFKGILKGAVP